MNLLRRTFVLAVLLCPLLVAAFGTVNADPLPMPAVGVKAPSFTLNSPTNGQLVNYTIIAFSWMQSGLSYSNSYKITLTSMDGLQSVVLKGSEGLCPIGHCNASFYPDQHDWKWRDGMTYFWRLTIKSAEGVVVGKSATESFQMDIFGDISLSSPAHGANNPGTFVSLTWTLTAGVEEYRVVITGPNGYSHQTPWTAQANTCFIATCSSTHNFGGLPLGVYKWKVLGRREFVAGKTSSSKYTLNIVK